MNNVERYFNGLCDELIKACNIKNATNIEQPYARYYPLLNKRAFCVVCLKN